MERNFRRLALAAAFGFVASQAIATQADAGVLVASGDEWTYASADDRLLRAGAEV